MKNAFILEDNRLEVDVKIYPGSILNRVDRVIRVDEKTVLPPGTVVTNGSILVVKPCALCVLHDYILLSDCVMECGPVNLTELIRHFVLQIRSLQKRIVFLEKELAFDKARIQRLVKELKDEVSKNLIAHEAEARLREREAVRLREQRELTVAVFRLTNSFAEQELRLHGLLHDFIHEHIPRDVFNSTRRQLRCEYEGLVEELRVLRESQHRTDNA
jgi:hypothetical protein